MSITLPVFYLPSLSWFSLFLDYPDKKLLERFEHFPKQTYRNRCLIASANGPLSLIIPVEKGSKVHTVIKDVRISYEFPWQRVHWMSLQTSYRSSAYFEYYEEEFAPFFHREIPFLLDFNTGLLELCLRLLKKDQKLEFTEAYEQQEPDYRKLLHPKKKNMAFGNEYQQVFQDRHGFIPDLSIVDLLFNKGPQAYDVLLP